MRSWHKLENGEKWTENGSVNYNIILQLNIYCPKMGMWADFPIFRLSLSFTKIPPYTALNSKFREPENSPDILDDPLLSSPISQGKKKKNKLPLLLRISLLLQSHLLSRPAQQAWFPEVRYDERMRNETQEFR